MTRFYDEDGYPISPYDHPDGPDRIAEEEQHRYDLEQAERRRRRAEQMRQARKQWADRLARADEVPVGPIDPAYGDEPELPFGDSDG